MPLANPLYARMARPPQGFQGFAEFYPWSLGQHANRANRRLHIIGTSAAVVLLCAAALAMRPLLLLGVPVLGYGAAWAGHRFFERNTPTTFEFPLLSLCSDLLMWYEVGVGQRPF